MTDSIRHPDYTASQYYLVDRKQTAIDEVLERGRVCHRLQQLLAYIDFVSYKAAD